MGIHETIIEAIRNVQILEIQYGDFRNPAFRVDPYVYGVRKGVPVLFARRRSAGEFSDDGPGWDWLDVERILIANVVSGSKFSARREYGLQSRGLEKIYAQLLAA